MSETQGNDVDIHFLAEAWINLDDFATDGRVLDLGGGGEGMIGRLKQESVVAIDLSKRELEEAPDGPLKIVMDAADLKFLDGSFTTATMFFSMMFMPIKSHQQVMREAWRVLRPGGRLYFWDASIPTRAEDTAPYVGIQLFVNVNGQEISTAYGRGWPDRALTREHYLDLARGCGFELLKDKDAGPWFQMIWEKPVKSAG
jgi:ubiquinone/menaquinone biosynthesis C-methylase UbiE